MLINTPNQLTNAQKIGNANMESKDRFIRVMQYKDVDRVPYFEEGIRKDVLRTWHKQGLPEKTRLQELFHTDKREEIQPQIDPIPRFRKWPRSNSELARLKRRLNPATSIRLPKNWKKRVEKWQNRDHVLMLRTQRGFFQSLGVGDWSRFDEVIQLILDEPALIRSILEIQGNFVAALTERILTQVQVDALVFSEPIGGNHGPLISPQMYEELVLKSYEPILRVIRKHGIETIIWRTYANAKALLPSIMKWGFNCLWACEVNREVMNYTEIREEYGRDLRLIGGIDIDILRQDKEAIKREVLDVVPPLIEDGGFIPLADGRVRKDVPYENYRYYRELLEQVTTGSV